jgi:hypothetical protein
MPGGLPVEFILGARSALSEEFPIVYAILKTAWHKRQFLVLGLGGRRAF